jgi:HSP20 family protein
MIDDKVAQASFDPVDRSTGDCSCEYSPRIDVLETAEEFRLEVELPGIRPEDVDVDLESGILRIRGQAAPRDESGFRVRVREFGAGDFARALRLGDSIDAGRISAETKDGLLTLRLPKKGALIPRTISVISAN